ncbi:hypothetical protein Dsin_018415 [Dipteronia sinensis]|uniref:Transposase n=1 Tax=Dipteronia sinensis TaxID=43782 RepID=A0AAE0A650_9ROSI|nr:hypothetical protein Dsin_018415 [Dipteronia sinensis]
MHGADSYNHMLEILRDMLPYGNTLPDSLHSTKKLLKTFDLGYEKIDACINDCCLFWKEREHLEACPKCDASRWKTNKRTNTINKGIPAKVLRYFPIIPRLKRMFSSAEKAEQLLWHSNHKSQDGRMRHPVDSMAWERIDSKYPSFASDPRNLRLALSTDGFNPFGDMSSRYSCWHVILVTYNLPPALCMSKDNMILSLLISGPSQPGNDIDVYLEPLIDDLKELWNNGIQVYDAFSKCMFNLKAILMWTINDFPAYGNLAEYPTKGKVACPVCGMDTNSDWLKHSHKFSYLGHRRFLPPNHSFRKKANWFNGKEEHRGKPRTINGVQAFRAVKDWENDWGKTEKKQKGGKKRKRKDTAPIWPWKKRSIFFDLPYWKNLLLCHNLDVMHVEKNICESFIGTLLNIKGKTKDGINSRKDLEEMGIRDELHARQDGKRFRWSAGPYTLSRAEKRIFCERLLELKLPDGYSSNISGKVSLEDCKIIGLKSHDCHILLQQLLPVALRGLLPKELRTAKFRLCAFYNELCQRVVDKNRLEALEDEVAETLCILERFFPPSFFDVMVHLTIHLAREARIGGPIQYRWQYPFESGYMKHGAEIGVRYIRNQNFENEKVTEGRPILQGKSKTMTSEMLEIAHRYVLFDTADCDPFIEMHLDELRCSDRRLSKNESLLQKRHMKTFSAWLENKVKMGSSCCKSTTVKWLACKPRKDVMSYSGFIINGHRFHTRDVDRSTQNSGVSLKAETLCQSSAKNNSQAIGKITYYGVIRDIIVLDYHMFKVPLFHCDWANIRNGVKVEDGFTLVNLLQGQHQFEKYPFILASQAKQVSYSREKDNPCWYVVLKTPARAFNESNNFDDNAYTLSMPVDVTRLDMNFDDEGYARDDSEDTTYDPTSKEGSKRAKRNQLATIVSAIQHTRGRGVLDESDTNKGKRKPRGRAKLTYLSKGKQLHVEFNTRGQPFEENAAKFSSLLGATAMELVHVTLKTWKDLAQDFRNQLWEHAQKRIEEANKNAMSSDKYSVKNDALTKALGPECRGRVRGLGFGTTPSQMGAQMKRLMPMRAEVEKWHHQISLKVMKFVQRIKMESSIYNPEYSGNYVYQVKENRGEQFVVNIEQKTCACNK